ncbi:MAG: DNA polymerase III subunit beta [Clostridia bacterium]|nr:DNA polymerase III subunit beta [Clostridia bacterium]MBP5592593.1 DNA polymerase III subunit beta [Clostridia bacterium]MBP5648795.1 DNA polymerase III subunit beta [Clostridia bacterium]
MKLFCDGNDLILAVAKVVKALGSKTTSPVLESIKMDAEPGTLTLCATDNEMRIETSICADVDLAGSVLVPGRLFSDFTKKLSNQKIELEEIGTKLKVRYAESRGELSCTNADEFPAADSINDGDSLDKVSSFTMGAAGLRELIDKVAFAVALSDKKLPILRGVLIEVKGREVTGVAVDGVRMAKCVKPIDASTGDFSVVIPSRSINEIARFLDGDEEKITVFVKDNKLKIDLGHTVITSQLLVGEYPDYNRLLPSSIQTSVIVLTEPLSSGLERAALLSKEENSNSVYFSIGERVISLTSASGKGNLDEKISVVTNGPDLDIAFNCKFFNEVLRASGCEQVTIKFVGPNRPCIIEPCGGEENFTYLILPVRT